MSRVLQELVELAARGETDAIVALLRNVGRVLNPSAAEGGCCAAADRLRTHMNLPLVARLTAAAHYSARLFSRRPPRDSGFVQDRLLLRASTH